VINQEISTQTTQDVNFQSLFFYKEVRRLK